MSKYCIGCKKLYIPGDRSSSFHCFPKDVEQRKKWMQIIGISTCPQNARVCSDHFESSCYHPNDDYQTDVRKLRSNAIPSLKRESDITNVQASPNEKHYNNYNHVTIQRNENVQQHNFLGQLSVDKEHSNKTFESNTENNNLQIFNELSEHSSQSNLDYNRHAITSSLFIENSSLKREIDSKESFHFPNKKLCSIDKQDDSTVNSNLLEKIVIKTEVPNAIKSTSNVLKRKITVDTVQGHVTKKLCLTNNENSQAAAGKNITHKIKNESGSQNVQNIRIIKRKPWNKSNSSNVLKLKTTFQWKDGKAVKHFTRQDFASDKAWNEFLKFTVVKRQQREALQRRYARKVKKINSLNEVIKTLKDKKEQEAAEYLKGLPETLKQIVARLKNDKPTSPFPEHLKTFARSLRFHSAAAYEMVRSTFLNCLPTAESLNRWENPKNYNPGKLVNILSQHLATHHENRMKNVKCSLCPKSYFQKNSLSRHMKLHHMFTRIVCERCGKYCNEHNIDTHYSSEHPNETEFKCAECEATFTRLAFLKQHAKSHADETRNRKRRCNNYNRKNKSMNKPSRPRDDESFVRKYKFRIKEPDTPITCKHCLKTIKGLACYRRHLETHLPLPRYKCRYCDISYTSWGNRWRHEKLHKDPKYKFRCGECWKIMENQDELDAHMAGHAAKPKKYQCGECSQLFCREYQLRSHVLNDHIKEDDLEQARDELLKDALMEFAV